MFNEVDQITPAMIPINKNPPTTHPVMISDIVQLGDFFFAPYLREALVKGEVPLQAGGDVGGAECAPIGRMLGCCGARPGI